MTMFPRAVVLCAALAAASPLAAQRGAAKPDLKAVARKVMISARYCALITVDDSSQAVARTVDPLAPDTGFVVWIATNPKSRKLDQVRKNPRVTLYYFDEKSLSYATLSGRAELVTDAAEKRKHWKAEWAPFYPNRANMTLLKVTPERLEVLAPSMGVLGDSVTWLVPAVPLKR